MSDRRQPSLFIRMIIEAFVLYFPEHNVSLHVNLCEQGNVWQIQNLKYPRMCSAWLLLHGLVTRAWAWSSRAWG